MLPRRFQAERLLRGELKPPLIRQKFIRQLGSTSEAQVQQEVTAAIEAEERELEQMRMEGEQEEIAAE
jgi:DNA-directed RNA polymerase subunit beta'